MRRIAIAILGSLLLSIAPVDGAQDPKKKDIKIPLAKITLKKGALRLGFDLKGEIPANGWQAKIGTDSFTFLDMNGSGTLEPDLDGLVMTAVSAFIVPIPDKLLLKTGQFALAFDGTKSLALSPDDLGAAQGYVAGASLLTEIRTRVGLRPFTLDGKACLDAEKHCEYMRLNGLNVTGQLPANPHIEVDGKPGYTNEGATAGANGNIYRGGTDPRSAILGWYTTPYHGSPIINPALKRIGLAARSNVCVLYFLEYGAIGNGPYAHPPDGSTGIPTVLGNGEMGENPNPVPGTTNGRGCGMPILVRLDGMGGQLAAADVTDAAGRPVQGTFSCPNKPANASLPDNMGCAFFIPSKPLAPNTLYKVTFKFSIVEKTMTWSFTTGAR